MISNLHAINVANHLLIYINTLVMQYFHINIDADYYYRGIYNAVIFNIKKVEWHIKILIAEPLYISK
jgi:hypothetical protein